MTIKDWERNDFEAKFIDFMKTLYEDIYDIKIDKDEERVRIYFRSFSLKVANIACDSPAAMVRDVMRAVENGGYSFCADYPDDVDWSKLDE